jgi:import inner membrane translocase subunit TIM44
VVKEIQLLDPTFKIEAFLKDAREYIVPEILEAFLRADLVTLKTWCGEGVFNVLKANIDATRKPGTDLEGRVYDMRSLDVITAKVVGDHPVLVLSFHTQQTSYVRDRASGAVVEGSPDKVEGVMYVWALAKQPESDPITGGWRLIEMAMRPDRGGF